MTLFINALCLSTYRVQRILVCKHITNTRADYNLH